MKILLLITLLFFALNSAVLAQIEGEDQQLDSLWNLEDLNPDDYDFTEDFPMTYSKGWFPRPLKTTFGIGLSYAGGSTHDAATKMRSNSFVPTYNGFQGGYGFKTDQQEIKKQGSEDFEDEYPEPTLWDLGLTGFFSSKYLILEAQANYSRTHGILSSIDDTRSFLNLAGHKQKFLEGAVVHIADHNIRLSLGLTIPIYGAFVFESFSISSYYYIQGGVVFEFPVSSKATQYFQILDVKDDLRYGNGTDTVRVMHDVKLKTLTDVRKSFEIAIGGITDFNIIGLEYSLRYSFMFNSMLTDAVWKQHQIRLNFGIYYNIVR
ncbi:MAG: hypothetical protein KGZ71_12125 [Desulfobulbaceae bacterium]|nr:hypothetical protein [Candidatus Kapabacteria bacterium]MBS4001217.1 hypothetical protein [Desulfobulbaceae bacterium]